MNELVVNSKDKGNTVLEFEAGNPFWGVQNVLGFVVNYNTHH